MSCRGPRRPRSTGSTGRWACTPKPRPWRRRGRTTCSGSGPSEAGMTRKALLIGSQTNGLTGVLNDVEAMAAALEPRGFQVTRLVTPVATREAILDAYEKLIVDAAPDDAFVLYYS